MSGKLKPFFTLTLAHIWLNITIDSGLDCILLFRMISTIWFAMTSKNNEYKYYGVALTVMHPNFYFLVGIYTKNVVEYS